MVVLIVVVMTAVPGEQAGTAASSAGPAAEEGEGGGAAVGGKKVVGPAMPDAALLAEAQARAAQMMEEGQVGRQTHKTHSLVTRQGAEAGRQAERWRGCWLTGLCCRWWVGVVMARARAVTMMTTTWWAPALAMAAAQCQTTCTTTHPQAGRQTRASS